MNKVEEPVNVVEHLMQILELELVEEDLFLGHSLDLGLGNIFGGQTIGQALSAAKQTVNEDRIAHSLHAYFLRPGDPSGTIHYRVERPRDGRSFNTRLVKAIQRNREICCISVSFKIPESGLSHQDEAPDVPGPEGLESEEEIAWKLRDKIPGKIRDKILSKRPVEIRPVNPMNPFAPEEKSPDRYAWFKVKHPLPEDRAIHRRILAYSSDFGLVSACMYPHSTTFWDPNYLVASLDHSLWFHRDFRVDNWLLYAIHSPNASNACGLNMGKIFTRDGTLVASTAQEGLVRERNNG